MLYSEEDRPIYYSQQYDNFPQYDESYTEHAVDNSCLPSVSYLNERKCPIYVHNIKKDSSVYNNYNVRLTSPRLKPAENHQISYNPTKYVLDKLEETYWATWKPKKEPTFTGKLRTTGKFPQLGGSQSRGRKAEVEAHGDSKNIIKHFKAKRFDSNSITDFASFISESNKPEQTKRSDKYSVSHKIQTEIHCPVILPVLPVRQIETNINKSTKIKRESCADLKEKDFNNPESPYEVVNNNSFVNHKDSIEITKKKIEETPKEHYQQPKCIKLYRRSGHAKGYLRGGTYPLKSCLKKEVPVKGNFRLGPPGSPLFLTNSSYVNRKI